MQLAPRQLEMFRADGSRSEKTVAPAPVARPALAPVAPLAPAPAKARHGGTSKNAERAHALAVRISQVLGAEWRVVLVVHDNRSTMVSFRRTPPVIKLRLHHMFLDAPEEIVHALAAYACRGKPAAGRTIDDFIALRQDDIRSSPRNPDALVARGRCFDLDDIFKAVNATFFNDAIVARIGWGRNTAKRRRKSIRLGVYDHKVKEIRVHPALDHPDVPRFFVEFIVFHEMLHQLFPSDRHVGRHVHHPPAFRAREKQFPHYRAAMNWEKDHIQKLLRQ